MPRTSLRKKQAVSYNEDHNNDEMPKAKVARAVTTASKIVENTNGAVPKAVSSKVVSAKTVTKRKAEPEAEPDSAAPAPAPAPAVKTAKKRKTKAKDEDATPLMHRTAVSTLKPAMHIGAHVSAAGGTYTLSSLLHAFH
jgi:AP endonuclease-1